MILTIAVVISTLDKLVNQKPPIVRLSDAADYRFETGSYSIGGKFKRMLITEQLPEIRRVIKCYGIDTVEVVGHTDATPNQGVSNLDSFQSRKESLFSKRQIQSGSNADLGLLRAISVEQLLKENLKKQFPDIEYRSYSASSFIDPDGSSKSIRSKSPSSQQSKRRIEVRFTRSETSQVIPQC
jgi:outer membrane protein OmpA-like peptidoglycan-associated protein